MEKMNEWKNKHHYKCPTCKSSEYLHLDNDEPVSFHGGSNDIILVFSCENCGTNFHIYYAFHHTSCMDRDGNVDSWFELDE